jgi:hypothetical protein
MSGFSSFRYFARGVCSGAAKFCAYLAIPLASESVPNADPACPRVSGSGSVAARKRQGSTMFRDLNAMVLHTDICFPMVSKLFSSPILSPWVAVS